jgi:hypothetical protein
VATTLFLPGVARLSFGAYAETQQNAEISPKEIIFGL